MPSTISLADIQSTINEKDPVLRNLLITRTYAVLSGQIGEIIGQENVNWCTFATWASKTAGQFIRLDSLDAALEEFNRGRDWIPMLRDVLPDLLRTLGVRAEIRVSELQQLIDTIARRTAVHVAEGNLLVFRELAPLFATFLTIQGAPDTGGMTWAGFLSRIESLPYNETGENKLFHAFSEYANAIDERDPKKRAESIFLANLLIGYHEQVRLDHAIDESLNAPVDAMFRDGLMHHLRIWIDIRAPHLVRSAAYSIIQWKLAPVVDEMARRWRAILTKQMMVLHTPAGTLDLSEDLAAQFPGSLQTLAREDINLMLGRLDQTPNTLQGSGARDWSQLEDRMNFIADFFRAYQEDRRLFQQPFSPEQDRDLQARKVPAGKL